MKQKYELIKHKDIYQIIATKNFGNIKKGTLGGYVTSEKNLSQEGKCWIEKTAYVLGDSTIKDDALVKKGCYISGHNEITGSSIIGENNTLLGTILVYNATIEPNNSVCGDVIIGKHPRY